MREHGFLVNPHWPRPGAAAKMQRKAKDAEGDFPWI